MAYAARSTDSMPMSAINITPMVGLMLALTMVFLVIGRPVDAKRLPMQIPQAMCGVGAPVPRLLVLSIKSNGELYLDGRYQTDGRLASSLRIAAAEVTTEAPLQLVIRAEPTTRYDRFTDILAMAHQSGIAMQSVMAGDFYY